jgi:hypothetical protein
MGAVSDSYYIVHSGILDAREKFAKADFLTSLPFTNIWIRDINAR